MTVNRVKITEVTIDSHYEEKHLDHMNDSLILKLVIYTFQESSLAESLGAQPTVKVLDYYVTTNYLNENFTDRGGDGTGLFRLTAGSRAASTLSMALRSR